MLTIKQIVVVLEAGRDIQPAWSMAKAWAALANARLHVLLPVQGEGSPGLSLGGGLRQSVEHTAQLEGERWLASWLEGEQADVTRTVVAGEKWCDMVLHEARRQEADLLIVGSELESRRIPQLMRQLPCPLYVARRGKLPVCLAGAVGASAEDQPHRLLNAAVLEHLTSFGKLWGAKTRVLSAFPNPVELVPLMGDAYVVGYAGLELEEAYRKQLEDEVRPFGFGADDIAARAGRPDVVLPDLVENERADCLLLGTVARQSLAAFWLGNTAEDVLPRLDCDVLVLRPQDYYEPDVSRPS